MIPSGQSLSPRLSSIHAVRRRLVIAGVVQGVGFRPFVYRLASSLGLAGWVLNSTEGVVVEVEGTPEAVDLFVTSLPEQAPTQARIERIDSARLPGIGYTSFAIEPSQDAESGSALVPPDICICEDCLRELRNPEDRRYRYPFVNCTNCGPRFTIVKGVPYDRPRTTMSCFQMCPRCEAEYHDPGNRRFHAQPIACPDCGPKLWLSGHQPSAVSYQEDLSGREKREGCEGDAAVEGARRLLAEGVIVAVKGLGGVHLACDAGNDDAVAELRRRKRRTDKPFAVMSVDADTVARYCYVSNEERQLLESPQRPIVLLRRRDDSVISTLVAPGNNYLGVMLPYTPLHYLLLEQGPASPITRHFPVALVMTSGNISEEPIATGNREALERLASLADAFLMHDRDIEVRCDDSVTRVFRGKEAVVRRSRGYAPFPLRLGFEGRDLLACGGHLKNTFCLTKGGYAFLSQHIGDLENAETLASFAGSVEHFQRLFRLEITAVAHDLHPDYLSTRLARDLAERGQLPRVPVQHHHAHIAACAAENGIQGPIIGVAFDGTGYGDDGCIWGGEFLICDGAVYRRAAHLKYMPLPGGEAAVRHPHRMAISYLMDAVGANTLQAADLPPLRQLGSSELAVIRTQVERRINSPLTSSMGRLFDAVSSLIGLRHDVTYEGQAAIELEMVADVGETESYRWELLSGEPLVIDMAPAIRELVQESSKGVSTGVVSARFHNTVADVIARTCSQLRRDSGIATVALSGGVFQNMFLLERAHGSLQEQGFKVLVHHQVPANDGGLALGQAVIANQVMSNG